jgi:hypothetical protein
MKSFILTLCGITMLLFHNTVQAQPRMVIEGNKFDIDTLMAGSIVEKKITLKNAGSEKLTISKVEASCGCTGTLLSSETLKPGESGELLITFNSKGFSGQVHKTVSVTSNDPQTPKGVITFTGFVIEEILLSESRFMFKDAMVGERKTANVTLTNNSKETLELMDYTTTLAGFTLKYPSSVKPKETVQLVAEFVPKEAKKVLSSNVAIKTSSKSKPELLLYVFGNVKEWKFE